MKIETVLGGAWEREPDRLAKDVGGGSIAYCAKHIRPTGMGLKCWSSLSKKALSDWARMGIFGVKLMIQKPHAESDWKKFRWIVPGLRDRYLRDQNAELMEILQRPALTPTEAFWAASDCLEKVKRTLADCLDDHKRSRMWESLRLMLRHGMLTEEDLEGFSEELRGQILALIEIQKK